MQLETAAQPSPRRSHRKRKRAMPPSDSSKTDSQRQGTCQLAASYCSSTAGTASLHLKRTRGPGSASPVVAPKPGGEQQLEEGEKEGKAPAPSVEEPLEPPPRRSQTVRMVEQRVAMMFKELDLLLRAEKINRRVMYRWSGSDRNSVELDENGTSYCTWGRELIKQSVEDAVNDVKGAMEGGDWDGNVDAARRLTLLYLSKANERSMTQNERPLHEEVMTTLGNLWFALLPLPQERRQQFRRLVARVKRTSGQHLVVAFRCALDFASVNYSTDLLEKADADTVSQLESLLRPEVYECDAYLMLWKISESLAQVPSLKWLCQEFRLKSLDAEMWRSMLAEEQETRQGAAESSDDDDEEGGEVGEEDSDDFTVKDLEALVAAVTRQQGGGVAVGTPAQGGVAGLAGFRQGAEPAVDGMEGVKWEGVGHEGVEQQQEGAPPPWSMKQLTHQLSGSLSSKSTQRGPDMERTVSRGSGSEYSTERGSWDAQDGDGEAACTQRWNTKAALEEGERDVYSDYLSLHQHQYRRVLSPSFLVKLWTFLEACDAVLAVAPHASEHTAAASGPMDAAAPPPSSSAAVGGGECETEGTKAAAAADGEKRQQPDDSMSSAEVLFVRARPFLYRIVTMLPEADLKTYLDLLASKFTFAATLQLVEPLMVQEHTSYSTARVGCVVEWALTFEQGRELAVVIRTLVPQLESRSQLERMARLSVSLGPQSFPILDKALARAPTGSYERLAVELCRRAVEAWGVGVQNGAHLLVLRALRGQPSLGLYLKCRGCFLDPVTDLLHPLVAHLDPCSELSIGIRLVEGMVASAVTSMVASLDLVPPANKTERAERWVDFACAGVKGGQFPPPLLDRLFAHETFVSAVLQRRDEHACTCLDALADVLHRLADLASTHPTVVVGLCRAAVHVYHRLKSGDVCAAQEASVLLLADNVMAAAQEVAA